MCEAAIYRRIRNRARKQLRKVRATRPTVLFFGVRPVTKARPRITCWVSSPFGTRVALLVIRRSNDPRTNGGGPKMHRLTQEAPRVQVRDGRVVIDVDWDAAEG